ncbi:cell wall-binding repeat-containing protein [Microbacterium esteraromaticum]|uniref:cell wall-binding repeat-containing protein n=1 Tax=Microbacterium esteraromaticum TaxID=57043 RepID=UPI0030B15E92
MTHTVIRSAAAALTTLALAVGALIAAPAATASETARLWGADRYATAVAVSRQFAAPRSTVFVASGEDYPDALSATSAAALTGSPVLLTARSSLPAVVANELRRLRPARVVVLGGVAVVSDTVVRRLRQTAPRVDRIYGSDRYATSRALVSKFFPTASSVVLATGRGFADGLAAGVVAGRLKAPALLVDGQRATLDPASLGEIRRLGAKRILLSGGHGSISIRLEQQLRTLGFDVSRHGGASRYETAMRLMAVDETAPRHNVLLASGEDFPDALTGAALAARTGADLYLTRPNCVPAAPQRAIAQTGAPKRTAIGGVAVVGARALGNSSCGDTVPSNAAWKTSGLTFHADVAPPYADRDIVDVHSSDQVLDSTGLRVLNMGPGGSRVDHPVAYAQYGISALAEYQRSGEKVWLTRALRHAERLSQIHTERDGAWYFPYLFDWTYTGKRLYAPWWSAMAQGEALSLFVRLYEQTADSQWLRAADSTWLSLTQPRSASEPWATMTDGGLLVFEEYAGNLPPLRVLNGHLFALFGAYDYWRLTGDDDVLAYLDGAATTALTVMPRIRVDGDVSYYCWQKDCAQPVWQNPTYHVIHSWQLDTLARLTGDARFSGWAATLRDDWAPRAARTLTPTHVLFTDIPDDESLDPPQ